MAYADSIRTTSPTMEGVATLIEGIFSSGYGLTVSTWTPTLTASGSMTYTSTSVNKAIYVQVGKLVFFNVSFTGTVGGSVSTALKFTLPITAAHLYHAFHVTYANPTTILSGAASQASTTVVDVYNSTGGNWTAGTAGCTVQGWYEAA